MSSSEDDSDSDSMDDFVTDSTESEDDDIWKYFTHFKWNIL